MGVSIQVDLDMRPMSVDLVFPKGIEAGGRVSLNFWRSSWKYGSVGEVTEKTKDRSLCRGNQVTIIRKRPAPEWFDHDYACDKIKVVTSEDDDDKLCYLSESSEVLARKRKRMLSGDESNLVTSHVGSCTAESAGHDDSMSRDSSCDAGLDAGLPDVLSSDDDDAGRGQVAVEESLQEVEVPAEPEDVLVTGSAQLNLESLVQSLLNTEESVDDVEMPSFPVEESESLQVPSPKLDISSQEVVVESEKLFPSPLSALEKEVSDTQIKEQGSAANQPLLEQPVSTTTSLTAAPQNVQPAAKTYGKVKPPAGKQSPAPLKAASVIFACSHCTYKSNNRDAAMEHCKSHIGDGTLVSTSAAGHYIRASSNVICKSRSGDAAVPLISSAFSLNTQSNVKVTADTSGLILAGDSGKFRLVKSQGALQCGALFTAVPLKDSSPLTNKPRPKSASSASTKPSKSAPKKQTALSQGAPKTPQPSTKVLFKCFKCDHQTYDRSVALQHLSFHTVEKKADPSAEKPKAPESYTCGKCCKVFNVKSSYMKHMRRHMAPKEVHECTYCDRRFSNRSYLNAHVRMHTRDYPFKCDQCTKGYMTADLLDKHKTRVHADPVFCMECNLPFKLERNLTYHKIKHHAFETDFKCDKCSNYFTDRQDLVRHVDRCGQPSKADASRRCLYCSYEGPTYPELTSHVQQCHPSATIYNCSTCDKVFVHADKLKTHEKGHRESQQSKKTPYKCPVCGKHMQTQNGLQSHLCTHNNVRPYKCTLCGATFASKGNLRIHTVNTHSTEKFTCDQCPKVCSSQITLRRHIAKTHSQDFAHECDQCHKRFNTEQRLQKHMALIHMGDTAMITEEHNPFPLIRPFACDLPDCNFTTFSPYRIKAHKITHTGVMPFECATCGKSFVVQDELTRHMALSHTSGRGTHPCPFCKRVFVAKARYDWHMQLHDMGSGYCCPECGQLYESKSYLEHHMQSHSAENNFKCSHCERTFKVSRGLTIHMFQSHPETRKWHTLTMLRSLNNPHPCDQCLMKFKTTTELKAHKLARHLGVRPVPQYTVKRLPCTFCPRMFAFPSELTHHLRIHTGETPYSCEHCQKKFRYAHSMRKHVTVMHTKDFKFFCPLCKKGYIDNAKVRQHLKSAHKAVGDSMAARRRPSLAAKEGVDENSPSPQKKSTRRRVPKVPAEGMFVIQEEVVIDSSESAVALLQTLF